MLVPGFEPGSTDRESVMMDRTTLHERCGTESLSVYENDAAKANYSIFTFTFTLISSTFIDMTTARHRSMRLRQNREIEFRYRKRPDPYKVIAMDCLKRTGNEYVSANGGPMVNHSGLIGTSDCWHPIARSPIRVEVSPSSWEGLHSRMMASHSIHAEVA